MSIARKTLYGTLIFIDEIGKHNEIRAEHVFEHIDFEWKKKQNLEHFWTLVKLCTSGETINEVF